jgi:Mrp family chromosome partitioning ATPase
VVTSKRVEINLDSLSAAGIVSPHSPRSQIADQYRVIKRPLIANAMGKSATPVENGNLIMVTSSLPGEGKSFTAINLAISIAAELDNTVMLFLNNFLFVILPVYQKLEYFKFKKWLSKQS